MPFQTTKKDLHAGWRKVDEWESFTIADAENFEFKDSNDLLYFADWSQVESIEELDDSDVNFNVDQKLAFMHAYLSLMQLESRKFESDVQSFLGFQSRIMAPRSMGFWLWQSDIGKFGAGASPIFQGEQVSIFADNETRIDFADTYTVMPYDCVLVRNPFEKWTKQRIQRLVDRMTWDLGFDGIEASIDAHTHGDVLWINIHSNDLGIPVD